MNGYIQIYTGDGKGKTTAAIGLTVRAAGAGLKILFAQFIKGGLYSEIKALKQFPEQVTIRQYGQGRFIKGKPSAEDQKMAQNGLAEIHAALLENRYDVIVLDEANAAISCGLFELSDVMALIDTKPAQTELVITGRNAHPALIDRADLVTEMKAIKHYYNSGVIARTGIEK